jgi:signal transduction histidine kinase
MSKHAAFIAAIVGSIATLLAARAVGMGATDVFHLVAIAGGSAIVIGVIGGALLFYLKERAIGLQVAVVAGTCVAAVGVGASTAANEMFLTGHDLKTLMVILVASASVGVVVAFVLGHRVAVAERSLSQAARRFGSGGPWTETSDPTGEFGDLSRELSDMAVNLERSRERERAVEASRRELVAWVSHDLRTPLAGIRAMAEALEDGVVRDAPTVDRYHHALRIEADRLAGLVDDLFELSRINSGTLDLQLEETSLDDLLSDALAASAGIAHAKGIRLEGRVATTVPALELSTREMARALRNILENAIHHTPSDGVVLVEAGADDRHAFFSVADECGGIPESDIGRVFDLAFRGEAARTPQDDRGAGLGLAIAKGIVEAHRGQIAVHNDGTGCRFTVRLPLTPTTEVVA